MSISSGWFARNRSRSYPLKASASAISDQGECFPESFIADLKLRFNGKAGDVVHISQAEITSKGASLTINLGDLAIATASISLADIAYRPAIPFTALQPGTIGHVVFGEHQRGVWQFQGPKQSGLSWKAASPAVYDEKSARFRRHGTISLPGPNLQLVASGDVRLNKKVVSLSNGPQEAIVISLASDAGLNTLANYTPDYGRRPESGTCCGATPIESINGVRADCCGRVFLEFRGCAELTPISGQEHCGAVVSCNATTEELCPSKELTLPTRDGILPGEEDPAEDNPEDDPGDCEPPEAELNSNSQEF